MKQFLIFIGGFVAGIAVMLMMFFIIGFNISASKAKEQANIQYVEIKGKKGRAMLHTGMLKDSVQILLGKPDMVDLSTIGSNAHESWDYIISKKYGSDIADLHIKFVNGKLERIDQD